MRYWVWRSIDNVAIGALPRALVTAVTTRGGVPEWLKGADCKSARVRLRWFESSPLHHPKCLSTIGFWVFLEFPETQEISILFVILFFWCDGSVMAAMGRIPVASKFRLSEH